MWKMQTDLIGPKRPRDDDDKDPGRDRYAHTDMASHETVRVFDRLYEENKGELLVKNTYPINQEAILDWLRALRTATRLFKHSVG